MVYFLWYILHMTLQGRHRTLDKHVKRSVAWLEGIESITKIVLGFSESCRHRYPPGHIRFRRNVSGGFKVNAYSGNGITDIFVKVDPIEDRELVKALIVKRFGEL